MPEVTREQAAPPAEAFDARAFVTRCIRIGSSNQSDEQDRRSIERLTAELMALVGGSSDDGEPVTEEWLRSIGFEQSDDKRLTFMLDPLIYSPPCGPLPAWQGIRRSPCQYWPIPVSETRGQLRQLMSALGLTNTTGRDRHRNADI